MGFLDSFGKKKNGNSAPPPPPGAPAPAENSGASANPATPPAPGTAPRPPIPTQGASSSDKVTSAALGQEDDEAPRPPKPNQASIDPKAAFTTIHNQNPPPDFKPDEVKLPKFDLPNFPKGYPELDFDIPTYGKAKQEGGNVEANAGKEALDKAADVKAQASEDKIALSDETDSNDNLSTAVPAVTPVDNEGNFKESEPATSADSESEKTTFHPSKLENVSSSQDHDDGRKHYEVEHDPFTKREPFLSQEERDLIDEKEHIHLPRDEPGTNKRRIGNVESTLHRKIKDPGQPVFVEINDYKRALNGVDEIRRDLTDSQELVHKLEEFNDKKHKEFERWKKNFQYIQSKLQHIDKIMFGSDEQKGN